MTSVPADAIPTKAPTAERSFPSWRLLWAITSTVFALFMIPTALVDHLVGSPCTEEFDAFTATLVAAAVLGWLAFVGRRRSWNRSTVVFLGLPSILATAGFVIGLLAILIHGPV